MTDMKKMLMVSGSLAILYSAAGCDMHKIDSYLAPDRRLPEGAKVNFDNRHVPMFNPVETRDGIRHMPSENISGAAGAASNMYPIVTKSPVVPVAAAEMAAPVPVVSVSPANATGFPPLASVPPVPQHPSKVSIQNGFGDLTSQQKTSESERANLMNDPNVTVMTSPKTGQVVDNPADAAFVPKASQSLPESGNGTVAALQAPAPQPQVQGNNAKATVASNDSKHGIVSWMDNLFSSGRKSANPPVKHTEAKDAVRKAPVENAEFESKHPVDLPDALIVPPVYQAHVAQTPARDDVAPVLREPAVHDIPTASLSQNAAPSVEQHTAPLSSNSGVANTEATNGNSVAAQVVGAANSKTQGQGSWMSDATENNMKTPDAKSNKVATREVGTAQNAPAAINTTTLPDIVQLSNEDMKPVNLVQPSAQGSYSANNYIEDSRYAEQRGHNNASYDNN